MHYLERWAQKPLFVISKRSGEAEDIAAGSAIEALRGRMIEVWSHKGPNAKIPAWLGSDDALQDHLGKWFGESLESGPNDDVVAQGASPKTDRILGIFETAPDLTVDAFAPTSDFAPAAFDIPFAIGGG